MNNIANMISECVEQSTTVWGARLDAATPVDTRISCAIETVDCGTCNPTVCMDTMVDESRSSRPWASFWTNEEGAIDFAEKLLSSVSRGK